MKEELDAIRAQLARIESGPGVAKASQDLRSKLRTKAHDAFCAGIEHLLLNGWSMRRIAQHLEVDPVTLKDWYEQGDRQRSQLPAWAIAGLPAEALPAVIRVELAWSELASGRTGTHG